jgi:large subunit ribosomal protein L15
MPHKRGFNNPFRVDVTAINLFTLNRYFKTNDEVTPQSLVAVGALKSLEESFKILASGAIDHSLIVRVPNISEAAKAKIEAAGGTVEEINATRASISKSD